MTSLCIRFIETLDWLFRYFNWPVDSVKIGEHVALLSGPTVHFLYCVRDREFDHRLDIPTRCHARQIYVHDFFMLASAQQVLRVNGNGKFGVPKWWTIKFPIHK